MSADLSQQIFYTGLLVSVLMGALYWLLRHFKKRTRKEIDGLESDGSPGDAAFNSIAQTDRIMQFMKSQGVNVSGAQVLLESARRNYRSKDYNAAIEYCKMARKSMMDSKNQIVPGQSTPEEIRLEGPADKNPRITATIPANRGALPDEKDGAECLTEGEDDVMNPQEMEQEDEEQEIQDVSELESRAQNALGRRSNKLPSKFMIQRALEAIQQAEKAGRPTETAIEALDIAEDAFERESYDKALSYANRARKIAEGEDVEPTAQMANPAKKPVSSNQT
ncbi:MAG: hypothetical protein QCI38_00430, partial [Candidatus Thermoplasmatota archaeon]|nr:hypothetical protein [Candidatus Thermoplasmatota archaeon]